MTYDTIIIGAGAAGLAAAAELARAGRSTLVVEARSRVGGRVWSVNVPGVPVPVELGAEFIHGRPASTFSLLAAAGAAAVDRTGEGWYAARGGLRPVGEVFAEVRAAVKNIRPPHPDISFDQLLRRELRHLSPRARAFARRRVEGYDAAHPQRISARAVLEEWSGEDEATAPSHFRPSGGYGALLDWLARGLQGSAAELRLDTVVREVRWERGGVEIEAVAAAKPLRAAARRAIVTAPLGVLQANADMPGAIRFMPQLSSKRRALSQLAVSPVVKAALLFRDAFWERLAGARFAQAGFFRAFGAAFPSYWTALPVRAPLLVAWAGGPHADRLAGLDVEAIADAALDGLESMFGKRAGIRRSLVRAWAHDWQRDPYARGAYSYVTVGGAGARRALARPIDATLYFAGEAANAQGEHGTVGGALHSGVRAARQALRGGN
jgi:monoamine oxidase